AAKTCLTCMASFCLEHLRPHQDSPAFCHHQLCPPLQDLQQRKCRDHNRLLEFFCREHATCICSTCLLSHKLCHTSPLQQAKEKAEVSERGGCRASSQLLLCPQIVLLKLASICSCLLQETASRKRDLIINEFSEIKSLIEEEENRILKIIVDEEKRICNKFNYIFSILGNKKNEIQSIRDQIEMVLTERDDILFLKRAAALQRVPTKDAFVPPIEMDQNVIHSAYQSAINMKEIVKLTVTQSREKKGEVSPYCYLHLDKFMSILILCPSSGASQHLFLTVIYLFVTYQVSSQLAKLFFFSSVNSAPNTGTPNASSAVATKAVIDSFLKKSREELLQYAAKVTLDYNTAHNKVVLSEGYTKMSVSEISLNYSDHPQRFTYCSQVLGFQCFRRGIHYWEVELQQNNFCGIGICYGSMERQGPDSRLGRNSSSWCIEWFNSKISAWHNDVEKCLPNTKATRIGVLLHCEGGFVIFWAVEEKRNLIYKYKTQFTEALYPAFWVFSSGTVLSVCQL
ncbi:E3 ubiquitin/ISG15 ligase TRIM25, partial [Struthio camelus australis]